MGWRFEDFNKRLLLERRKRSQAVGLFRLGP